MDDRAVKRAEARARAGVSTRGVDVAPPVDPITAITNETGEAVTRVMTEMLEKHGGDARALAAILEGLLLNAAWNLWANAVHADANAFRRTFAKLASEAAAEVITTTENEKPRRS